MELTPAHWDILRWVNCATSIAVVALMTTMAVGRWHRMSLELRLVLPWVIGTYVIIAYGSGEIAASAQEVPIGLRVTLLLVDLLGLAVSLILGMIWDMGHPSGWQTGTEPPTATGGAR